MLGPNPLDSTGETGLARANTMPRSTCRSISSSKTSLFQQPASVPQCGHSRLAGLGRECVKTLKPSMVQCIFGHVGSISRDFVDSNLALSNLHGKWFGFSHTLGQ